MSRPLILVITPRGGKGAFVGYIEGTDLRVTATRNPLSSAARSLLHVGVDPKTVLIMRNLGSSVNRVSGRLDVIVQKVSRKGADAIRRAAQRAPDALIPGGGGETPDYRKAPQRGLE